MASLISGEHELKSTLSVDVYAPDHPDRTGTPIFDATRKKLIGDNAGTKCEFNNHHCDLDHPLELHHKHVEWCRSNSIDWGNMDDLGFAALVADVPEFPWNTLDPSKPEMFIDSEYNACQVLCKKHHTGKDHGKHSLDEPTWISQKYQKASFTFSPDEAAL